MCKGEFRFKNIHNYTTECVKDKLVYYTYVNNICDPIFTLTHADSDYVYGYFEHKQNCDILIEVDPECIFESENV